MGLPGSLIAAGIVVANAAFADGKGMAADDGEKGGLVGEATHSALLVVQFAHVDGIDVPVVAVDAAAGAADGNAGSVNDAQMMHSTQQST